MTALSTVTFFGIMAGCTHIVAGGLFCFVCLQDKLTALSPEVISRQAAIKIGEV